MEDPRGRFAVEMMWIIGLVVCVASLPYLGWITAFYIAQWLELGYEDTRVLCLTLGLAISTVCLIFVLHRFNKGEG